jgi:hypothetical protein
VDVARAYEADPTSAKAPPSAFGHKDDVEAMAWMVAQTAA